MITFRNLPRDYTHSTNHLNSSISEIGKFKTVEKLVNLNVDTKRMWFEKLVDVNDGIMIDSMPITMSFI